MTHDADIVPFPVAADDASTDLGDDPLHEQGSDAAPHAPVESRPDTSAKSGGVRLRDVIGDVLRDERVDQGRTLADVADEAAVSLPYLSEIERGRKEVSSDVLDAVIRSLDLDLADVLERAADRLRLARAVTALDTLRVGRSQRGRPQAMLLAA